MRGREKDGCSSREGEIEAVYMQQHESEEEREVKKEKGASKDEVTCMCG